MKKLYIIIIGVLLFNCQLLKADMNNDPVSLDNKQLPLTVEINGRKAIAKEVLVKFNKGVASYQEAERIINQISGSDIAIKKYFPSLLSIGGEIYILVKSSRPTTELIDLLCKNIPQINKAYPNYIYRLPANPKTGLSVKIPFDSSPEMVAMLFDKEETSALKVSTLTKGRMKTYTQQARWINPTAPNEQTKYLSGDFTDSDGDGMTDVAELKYGFDPNDALSFPKEPEYVDGSFTTVNIENSGIGAVYEIQRTGITIKWKNPDEGGSYSLELYNGKQQLYYGGHYSEYAPVNYTKFNLTGVETLTGRFIEYGADLNWIKTCPEFTIDLPGISLPLVGVPTNRISYTFEGFPSEAETAYKEFLKKVWPIMYKYLGTPAETFNCLIKNTGEDSGYFMIIDAGRTFLSDTDFIPRLIVHEFIHAWKGNFTFTSDKNWEYDDALSGFEEGTAEGIAFEIIHEYVRCYPNDSATLKLLNWHPYQYWSNCTTYYDSIKYNRWTGAGDFWTHTGGEESRYSIAATTVQMMIKKNPQFYQQMLQKYFEKINTDSIWRPNREDIVNIWAEVMPQINKLDTKEYINSIPVFQGHKLDEGIYILNTIRPYGYAGDQQFAVSYVPKDGQLYWGILKSEVESYQLPGWIKYDPGDDVYVYIDTQNQPFTINIFDSNNNNLYRLSDKTNYERRIDSTANGFGWKMINELAMENFAKGLFKEKVVFDNYIQYDSGASEDFYFFGYNGFEQDRDNEYVIMVGIDGVADGTMTIVINDKEYTEPILNGAAIFRSTSWPFDMEGEFSIVVTNNTGESHCYYRTILEAGTYWGYRQYQFIIIDKNFNGIEDALEPPCPKINYITPSLAYTGQIITINGEDFGDIQNTSFVTLSEEILLVKEWSDTCITCCVPSGAKTGLLKITTIGGESNSILLTIEKPDLAIKNIYSNNKQVYIEVGNIGKSSIPEGCDYLSIWIDGKLSWSYSLSTRYSEACRFSGGSIVVPYKVPEGRHKIKAEIDPLNTVVEENEDNNRVEKEFLFDFSPPVIHSKTENPQKARKILLFQSEVIDNISGVDPGRVYLQKDLLTYSMIYNSRTKRYEVYLSPVGSLSNIKYQIIAYDKAGNRAQTSIFSLQVENNNRRSWWDSFLKKIRSWFTWFYY